MSKQKETAKWCSCTICDDLVWVILPTFVVDDEDEVCLGIICDECAKLYNEQNK